MNLSIKIVTDSTSCLEKQLRQDLDISVVSLSINMADQSYLEETIDPVSFFRQIEKYPALPTSSQPGIQDIYDIFEKHIGNGHGVVGIFISAELSGTYATALTAKSMIREKYPEARIEIIDSRSTCMEQGFAVLAAARSAHKGESLEQVIDAAREVMKKSKFLFIPQTLDYLKKGGRIGGASHLLGTVLKIKPILTVIDGKVAVLKKIRTSEKAIQEILRIFYEDVQKKGFGEGVVHHINDEKGAQTLSEKIAVHLGVSLPVSPVSPVIGAHVGPGALGIAYYTNK
ncbi:DegV family protein [Dehalobacterium formicoaceticum]|uniref:DegV family protein n=1 Tax=Dehalobacterium formicoaceticum TaxID=51515 RepID=A0ABT1Y0V8_9FIRM|nr:DegV family protein [Dehalobacterium formicoaceticum]MCR6544488.1 DegV family protein [Dehalobacterium formicoaceticum]